MPRKCQWMTTCVRHSHGKRELKYTDNRQQNEPADRSRLAPVGTAAAAVAVGVHLHRTGFGTQGLELSQHALSFGLRFLQQKKTETDAAADDDDDQYGLYNGRLHTECYIRSTCEWWLCSVLETAVLRGHCFSLRFFCGARAGGSMAQSRSWLGLVGRPWHAC